MITILKELVERPQTSWGKSETRPADSRTSTTSESGATPGRVRRGPSESFRWEAFSDRFDGLRIPSSPLHEF